MLGGRVRGWGGGSWLVAGGGGGAGGGVRRGRGSGGGGGDVGGGWGWGGGGDGVRGGGLVFGLAAGVFVGFLWGSFHDLWAWLKS